MTTIQINSDGWELKIIIELGSTKALISLLDSWCCYRNCI